MTSGCCPSDLTPPKGSTGSSAPPPRNARSPSARTCTRPASTRSCPRPSPRPSTGCCTTPTSARPAATASASPRPCPARGEILDLTEPGCSTGRQWADLVATTGPFSMALDRRRPVGRFAGPVDVGRDAATRRRGDAVSLRRALTDSPRTGRHRRVGAGYWLHIPRNMLRGCLPRLDVRSGSAPEFVGRHRRGR